MPRIGLLGCGNIASIIAAHAADGVEIIACYDVDGARCRDYARRTGATICADVDELLAGDYALLVEAASPEAVRQCLTGALEHGRDAVVLSVGALSDAGFLDEARALASRLGRTIHVPSGAVFGLDNIKVARISGLDRLLLRTTKAPRSLGMDDATGRQCIFRGKAGEAVRRFPKNINVSAALGLAAGREPDVELWVDPAATVNRHEIIAAGEFGEVTIRTDNRPSPDNPATSYLAALSVLTLLRDLDDPVRVGT